MNTETDPNSSSSLKSKVNIPNLRQDKFIHREIQNAPQRIIIGEVNKTHLKKTFLYTKDLKKKRKSYSAELYFKIDIKMIC